MSMLLRSCSALLFHAHPGHGIVLARASRSYLPPFVSTCSRPRQFQVQSRFPIATLSTHRLVLHDNSYGWAEQLKSRRSRAGSMSTFSLLSANPLRFRPWALSVVCATTGLALALSTQTIHCDGPAATHPNDPPAPANQPLPPLPEYDPPPKSLLNAYELSFGVVCGICTGVFVKKGARLVAFFLGGLFVLAQYLASKQIIRINWTHLGSKYEKTFYENGKAPTIYSVWSWFVDFILADFPPRATFVAGFLLGLRLG